MGKRNKPRTTGPSPSQAVAAAKSPSPAHLTAHPPAKNPTLLAVSILLFALWFVFLLVTALTA
jgi:hypothetical protein